MLAERAVSSMALHGPVPRSSSRLDALALLSTCIQTAHIITPSTAARQHRLVRVCVTVCQSQTNRVEVTGDDNRAGWEGWALDLPRTRQARRQRRCLTHEHDLTWERQFGGHGAEL
jgi:hypothetical protein